MIPEHVHAVLSHIRKMGGTAPGGFVGPRPFHNRERRLADATYVVFDVYPYVAGQNRGPERLIIDVDSGRAFYTSDHNRSFEPVNG